MGSIYQVKCLECAYDGQFHLGSGLRSMNLARHLSFVSEAERQEIVSLQERGMIDRFQIENKLVICEQCKSLQEKVIILIKDSNGMSHTFAQNCKVCGSSMKVYGKQGLKDITCPCCEKGMLEFKVVGHWD